MATKNKLQMKMYRLTENAILRLYDLAQVVHQGVWLGLLDVDGLHEIGERQYLTWKALYGNREYNLSGLLAWEAVAVDRFFSPCRSILIGGVGGGREMIALSRKGFLVDGFECCEDFVTVCKNLLAAEGLPARVTASPPDEIPGDYGMYDGLIMGWGAYMHIVGRRTRIEFFKQFRRHVRAGGPVLVSFLTRKPNSRKAEWVFRIARSIQRLCRNTFRVELGDSLHGSFAHFFTAEEIRQELREAGFQPEYYAEQPYGHAVATAVATMEDGLDSQDKADGEFQSGPAGERSVTRAHN